MTRQAKSFAERLGFDCQRMLDCHCHLDRYQNGQVVAERAAGRGVFTVAVTNLPSHFDHGLQFVRRLTRVRLALGLHPLTAAEHAIEWPRFERLFAMTSFIGEVGLDFSLEGRPTAEKQLESFDRVARLLRNSAKFVSVHSRRAEAEVLNVLAQHGVRGVVFHWYSGSLVMLERVLAEGHYLSVNPAMTRSAKGREVIKRVPPSRLLTETDGPYVTVGKSPAQPWDVQIVEDHVAQLWNVPSIDVRAQVWRNFQQIISPLVRRPIRPG